MPFKSQAQRAFLYANHPDVAAKFQEHTVSRGNLPLYSGPADSKDPKGSKQDVNPFVAMQQKKKNKKNPALQAAATRRLAKMKGQKGNASH